MLLSLGLACGTPKKQDDLLILSDDMEQRADLNVASDMGADLNDSPQDQGLPTTCQGDCSAGTLRASFNGRRATLGRSFYGLSAASTTDSGHVEVYIESMEGGEPGCPTMSSPTPKHTLIISGLKAPLTELPMLAADGLSAKLIDYDGVLLGDKLFASPEQLTIRAVATNLCIECLAQSPPSDEDGFIALDVELSFPQGTLSGRLYATHCDSLDARGQ